MAGATFAVAARGGTPAIRLAPPPVGDVRLTIVAPDVLEVSAISSPADAAQPDRLLQLASNVQRLSVSSAGRQLRVVAAGSRRRVRYAPLATRDLRVETVLFLEISPSLQTGAAVQVTGGPWASGPLSAILANDRRSPAIHVSQAGYVGGLPKRAQVGYYLGTLGELRVSATPFAVERVSDGRVVFKGALAPRPDRGFPGAPPPYQRVLEANLDRLEQPGLYRLAVEGLGVSGDFRVGPAAAGLFARTYALGLYHQRCGLPNTLPYTRFTHDACHLAPAALPDAARSSVEARLAGMTQQVPRNPQHLAPRLDRLGNSLYPVVRKTPVLVRGGHHDAGDYGKYTINSAQLVHHLVFAVDAFPGVAALDNLGLPESGDGVSDVLQIARQEADFLQRMQDEDGGFFFLVHPRDRPYESNVLPDAGDPQVVFPKNTSATAAATAALAQCASSPAFKRAFPADAARYLASARRGWAFLQQAWRTHGRSRAYQTVTHYGDVFEDRDEVAWAATEIFLATADAAAHRQVRDDFDPSSESTRRWGWWRLFEGYGAACRSYVFAARTQRLDRSGLDARHLARCEAEVLAAAGDQVAASRASAYGTSYPDPGKRSNRVGWYFGEDAAFDLVVGYQLRPDPAFLEALAANLSYSAGANPVNVSFIAGVGWQRPIEVVHQYAQNDRRTLPPTGLLVGNLQQGLPGIGWYGTRLRSLSVPPDADAPEVYPLYDRWSDVFSTMNEAVSVNIARGLAAASWLMARTPLATQPWTGFRATLETGPVRRADGRRVVRLVAPGADLSEAAVTWETDADPPRLGASSIDVGIRASWVEAEALLPDGRRIVAVSPLPGRQ